MVAFIASWSWDPTVLAGLALSVGLYAFGWYRLSRRGAGRPVLAPWRAWCFGAGLAAIGLALLSPIGAFGGLFFFMHMIQHLLLVEVAAPLLLLGAPLLPMLWGLPRGLRVGIGLLFAPGSPLSRVFGFLTSPLVALSLYATAVAVWHLPAFYDAAQGRTLVHDLQHSFFLGTALLFWWPVIHPTGGRRRLSYAAAIPYFLPPMLVGNLIGALLTFADSPLYATYQRVPRLWGLSVVQDQQLAGLIMWVPGGLVYAVPVFALMVLMFQGQQERAGIREQGGEAADDNGGPPGNGKSREVPDTP